MIKFIDFESIEEINLTNINGKIISIETIKEVTDSGTYYNRKSGLDEQYEETETYVRVWVKE